MSKVDYWDSEEGCQKTREATVDEQNEIDARIASPISKELVNAPILSALLDIDRKSIRALREGDSVRVKSLEDEAIELRKQLVRE